MTTVRPTVILLALGLAAAGAASWLVGYRSFDPMGGQSPSAATVRTSGEQPAAILPRQIGNVIREGAVASPGEQASPPPPVAFDRLARERQDDLARIRLRELADSLAGVKAPQLLGDTPRILSGDPGGAGVGLSSGGDGL